MFFRQSPSMTKIKQAKCFLGQIIRIGLVPPVVLSMKIKRRENLTGENVYQRKFPDPRIEIV